MGSPQMAAGALLHSGAIPSQTCTTRIQACTDRTLGGWCVRQDAYAEAVAAQRSNGERDLRHQCRSFGMIGNELTQLCLQEPRPGSEVVRGKALGRSMCAAGSGPS